MSIKKLTRALALAAAALVACSKEEAPPVAAAPAAAKVASPLAAAPKAALSPTDVAVRMGELGKQGDVKGMAQLLLPTAHYDKAMSEWDEKRKATISEEDRKAFMEGWGKLLAPGAVDAMMTEIEPKLVELKGQIPMYVAMGSGFAQQAIQADEKLTAVQKEQATALLTAVQGWAMKTDFSDAGRLRKALNEFASGARATKITTLEQLHALNFDQLLDKGSMMFAATKRALNAYDLNMDEMFSTLKSEQLSMAGDLAKVKTSFQFLGQTITAENDMVKVDGKWYGKDMLDSLEKHETEALAEQAAESSDDDMADDAESGDGVNTGAGN